MDEIHINAVAYKSGDVWIVQGIEYDIAARADDPASVPQAFVQALHRNIALNERCGRKALEGIAAAPEKFKLMFGRAAAGSNTDFGHVRFLQAA